MAVLADLVNLSRFTSSIPRRKEYENQYAGNRERQTGEGCSS